VAGGVTESGKESEHNNKVQLSCLLAVSRALSLTRFCFSSIFHIFRVGGSETAGQRERQSDR